MVSTCIQTGDKILLKSGEEHGFKYALRGPSITLLETFDDVLDAMEAWIREARLVKNGR